MRELVDCHTHTARCGHGAGSVADVVAAAEIRGLAGVTISEHLPLPDDLDPGRLYSMPQSDIAAYVAEVSAVRETAAIAVYLGLEADWLPGRIDHVTRLLAEASWDVVLGSVHFIEGWAFDDPDLVAEWDSRDVDAVWEAYFERLCDAASSGLYDVMSHPDLVKKFGHRPSRDATFLYDEAARTFAHAGVAAEVSTAGLRKPVAEIYPGPSFLEALVRHRVPLTLGSDAHQPSEVGYAFEDAVRAIRDAGGTTAAHFVARELREVVL